MTHDDDVDDGMPADAEDVDLDEREGSEAHRLSGGVGFVSGLVLGALIGAGIALLVAPQRGAVTRRRLRRKLRDVRDGARERVDDWSRGAKKELARQRRELKRRRRNRAF